MDDPLTMTRLPHRMQSTIGRHLPWVLQTLMFIAVFLLAMAVFSD